MTSRGRIRTLARLAHHERQISRLYDVLGEMENRLAERVPEHTEIDETNWTPARDMFPDLTGLLPLLARDSEPRRSIVSALDTIDHLSERVADLTENLNLALAQRDGWMEMAKANAADKMETRKL